MPIKDKQLDELVTSLAKRMGATKTEVIKQALAKKLNQLKREQENRVEEKTKFQIEQMSPIEEVQLKSVDHQTS